MKIKSVCIDALPCRWKTSFQIHLVSRGFCRLGYNGVICMEPLSVVFFPVVFRISKTNPHLLQLCFFSNAVLLWSSGNVLRTTKLHQTFHLRKEGKRLRLNLNFWVNLSFNGFIVAESLLKHVIPCFVSGVIYVLCMCVRMTGSPRDTRWDRAYRTARKISKSTLFYSHFRPSCHLSVYKR